MIKKLKWHSKFKFNPSKYWDCVIAKDFIAWRKYDK